MKRSSTFLVMRETLFLYLLWAREPGHAIDDVENTLPPMVDVRVADRGRQPVGAGRRALVTVVTIELETGRAAAYQTEVADALIATDTRHDPLHFLLQAVGLAQVIGRNVEALGGEVGADDALRRATVTTPQAPYSPVNEW